MCKVPKETRKEQWIPRTEITKITGIKPKPSRREVSALDQRPVKMLGLDIFLKSYIPLKNVREAE